MNPIRLNPSPVAVDRPASHTGFARETVGQLAPPHDPPQPDNRLGALIAGSTPEIAQALEVLKLLSDINQQWLNGQQQQNLNQLVQLLQTAQAQTQTAQTVRLHLPATAPSAKAAHLAQAPETPASAHAPPYIAAQQAQPKPISGCQSLTNALRGSLPRTLVFGSFRFVSALSGLALNHKLIAGFAVGGSAALVSGAVATGLIVGAGLAFGPAVGELVYPHASSAIDRLKRFALSYAPMTLTGLTVLAVALRNPSDPVNPKACAPALKLLAAAASLPLANLMRDLLLQLSSGVIARPQPANRSTGQALQLTGQQASELNRRRYGLNVAGLMLLGALQYFWLADSLKALLVPKAGVGGIDGVDGVDGDDLQHNCGRAPFSAALPAALTATLISAAGELLSNLSLLYAALGKGYAIAYLPGHWRHDKPVFENGQQIKKSVCTLRDKLSHFDDTWKLISDNSGMRNAFSSLSLTLGALTDAFTPPEAQSDPPSERLRTGLKLIQSAERGWRELRSLLVENGQKKQLTLDALQRPFTPYVQRLLEAKGIDAAALSRQLAQHLGAVQLSATYGRIGAQFEYEHQELTENHFLTHSSTENDAATDGQVALRIRV